MLTSYAAVRYFLTIVAEKKHDIRYNDPVVVCSHQSFKEMTLAGFSLVHLANSVLLDDITKAMRSIMRRILIIFLLMVTLGGAGYALAYHRSEVVHVLEPFVSFSSNNVSTLKAAHKATLATIG